MNTLSSLSRGSLLVGIFVLLCGTYLVAQDTQPKDADAATKDRMPTTSEETLRKYQAVNGSMMLSSIEPFNYNGPHVGPGLVRRIDGPVFEIVWPQKNKEGKGEPESEWASRLIPFSAIKMIDRPLGGDSFSKFVVYYTGAFGDTEFAFIKKGEFAEKFIAQWRGLSSR